MGVVSFNNGGGTILILAMIFSTTVAGEHHLQDKNRTCIPAEAEPTLNSSSCYPLVNFTRPFCQNHGITLPNYVFQTPKYQNKRNDRANKYYDVLAKISVSKISRYLKVDINTIRKCLQAYPTGYCRYYFPSCDRTQSVFKEQKLCHESCLELTHICGELWKVFERYYAIRHPGRKKPFRCELQPPRNAGDSPECWYFNGDANSTDKFPAPEWDTNADCLYLNGSSYHGNISVTASGFPCQSWTEQCPHRHTMNKTYPELNNAKNYCRNPKNSGQRPWCFTTDKNKRWEYCDIPKCIPVDGNYGIWSLNSTCNVTCGEGFGTWTRECNNPEPKYGGRNCSHLGEPVEYRPCPAKPCPVNGGYSNWTLSIPCSVSCGDGEEIWERFCNNPEPKYGGQNCSGLGNSTEFRDCSRKPCPIDGSYGNWTTSPCSATCGEGVEIRIRVCDNPPGKYGGNCSKQGPAQEIRTCKIKPCPVHFDSQMTGIFVVVAVFVIVVTVACFIFILPRRRRKLAGSHYYARLRFLPQRSRGAQQLEGDNTSGNVAISSQETGTSDKILTSEGEPTPGLSEKLGNVPQGDAAESGVWESNNTYSTMERPAEVILPIESENASTTENV
ncbi:partial [Paramuricea clavata]|uniref:Circumsporozoite protein n=1 Tax=Paramuricea clavata TaxID=317549 RepID=A0A6S7H1U1_PARCT|nr:partial [Paramuricea clavata]